MGAASYVTGSHNFRFGATLTNGDWRLIEAWTGDVQPITYNAGRPVSVTLRLPMDARNGIKRDLGLFVQDRWAMGRITLEPRAALRPVHRRDARERGAAESLHVPELANGVTYGECADGKADPGGCYGEVQNWKDISPRVGFAMDVFGNGRTARQGERRALRRRPAGRGRATGQPGRSADAGPTRARGHDLDGNGLPLDANGNIQFNELGDLDVDADLRPERLDDVLRSRSAQRLGQARLQHRIHDRRAASARRSRLGERRLLSPHVRQPDVHRRPALRRRAATTRSASTRRSTRACRTAAAAIRCAACTI